VVLEFIERPRSEASIGNSCVVIDGQCCEKCPEVIKIIKPVG